MLAALASGACATATNYLDPSGPRFEARFGDGRDVEPALRVVTFNVENGRRVQEAIDGLRTDPALHAADVYVLQEMDAAGVETIARALALNAVYFPATNHNGRDLGNAVLSPWPIEESWKVLLPHQTRIVRKARAAVAARVRVGDVPVLVYSVHLGSPLGLSPGRRREQAAALLADAEASHEERVVVAGDFNSASVCELFERAGFAWPTKKVGKTVGPFSYDHVLSRGLQADPARAGVARKVRSASDHRPVWSVLALE